jgi:hypothetical protein
VSTLSRVADVYELHRYATLFYMLLVTLALRPLLTALDFSGAGLQIVLALNLLVAVLNLPRRWWRTLLIGIAAVAAALRAAPASLVSDELATCALVAGAGIALLAAAGAMRFALGSATVGAEHVYAAMSAYLLGGLLFAVLHWAIAITWPGSFNEAGVPAEFPLATAMYFSFVTLATLGYGDIVPATEVARGLAILEAVAGQLYIAVTIARLVGTRTARS